MTCNVLAIRSENDVLTLEAEHERIGSDLEPHAIPAADKKSMVVVYDGGRHSEMVLKATTWLEHSGRFKVNLLSVNSKGGIQRDGSVSMQQDYLSQLGVTLKEIQLNPDSSVSSASIILSAVGSFRPDIVVIGSSVGGFSVFNNPDFLALLDQLNCPVIIARNFTIPGVHQARSALLKLFKK
jgi:hypothetical protein